jgi:hypothetical protein
MQKHCFASGPVDNTDEDQWVLGVVLSDKKHLEISVSYIVKFLFPRMDGGTEALILLL